LSCVCSGQPLRYGLLIKRIRLMDAGVRFGQRCAPSTSWLPDLTVRTILGSKPGLANEIAGMTKEGLAGGVLWHRYGGLHP